MKPDHFIIQAATLDRIPMVEMEPAYTMTFEQWAQEKGFDLSSLDEANQAALLKIYEAETAEPVQAEGTDNDKAKPEAKRPA